MHLVISFYIVFNMCAVGFNGNELYQAQQATLGLQIGYNNGMPARNLNELQNEKILNDIQMKVENSFKSFEERYYNKIKNGSVRKTESNKPPTENTYYDQFYEKETKDQPHSVKRIERSINTIPEESIKTTTETPTVVNPKFKKIDLYYDVKNLNDLQVLLVDSFEKMYKKVQNFINNLKEINRNMRWLYDTKVLHNFYKKELDRIMSKPEMDTTELTEFISQSAINVTQSLNNIKKYDEKIKKNKGFENLKLNVINELRTFYDNLKNLLNDATEMYKAAKPKLQDEIEAYVKTNENYENASQDYDKKISEYNKFATKIEELSLKKQNLNNDLHFLEFCIKHNNFFEYFNKRYGLECQQPEKINENGLTTSDDFEKRTCGDDSQEYYILLLLKTYQTYCTNKTQEVADIVVKTTKEKQCDGIKCGKTEFSGTSTSETQEVADIVVETTKENQCDGIECGKIAISEASTFKKTANGFLITSLLYSFINR